MQHPITCIPASMQWGHRRYPDPNDQPVVKWWRCELTGLSHMYNLYFVACNDAIYVYQPSYPSQSIASHPDLILHPPIVRPVFGRGIDPVDAHSITRLHVAYLGQEEIVLVTCDDGDVIGYHVKHIQEAVDRQKSVEHDQDDGPNTDEVRAFLAKNVGASAWGLAVHREARVIAISANTHDITVIAYALTNSGTSSKASAPGSLVEPALVPTKDFAMSRESDHVLTLSANSNIPSLSFNNNGDDPTGRWLTSTSITGEIMIWDLHMCRRLIHPRPTRVIELGWCSSTRTDSSFCTCKNHTSYPHAIWGALTINIDSAYEMTHEEALLQRPEPKAPCFKDVTNDVERFRLVIKDSPCESPSAALDNPAVADDDGGENEEMTILESDYECNASLAQYDLSESELPDTGASSGLISLVDSGDSASESKDEEGRSKVGENGEDLLDDSDSETESFHTSPLADEGSLTSLLPPSPMLEGLVQESQSWSINLSSSSTDTSSSQDSALYAYSIISKRFPFCKISGTNKPLPSDGSIGGPCVAVSKEELFLLQNPFHALSNLCEHGNMISMRRPLHPEPWIAPLPVTDRLSYLFQIAELGVFIIASPAGQAGVFSIYWTRRVADGQPQWGYRLEYLLPFEKGKDRKVFTFPGGHLIGIAAGPVQGMFDRLDAAKGADSAEGRRWRIFMYYSDHTVLSFELWKSKTGGSPSVSQLVI